MGVPIYERPDMTSQTGTAYRANIDGAAEAFERLGIAFLPQPQATPDMTVRVLAGAIFTNGSKTEIAAQNTGTITAPVTNPRIDRVVLDPATGAVSVVGGTEAASPVAPAIPSGKLPICRIALATSTTQITASLITDERATPTGTAALYDVGTGSGQIPRNQDIVPATVNFAATSRVLGRKTVGAGAGEELTLSELLDLIGSAAQGDILYRGASGWSLLAAGTSGEFLKTLGAGANPLWAAISAGLTSLTAVNTTSGVAIQFTGIPSTASMVLIPFAYVSTNGSSNLILQGGPSGGVDTSGYDSYSAVDLGGTNATVNSTAGHVMRMANAARQLTGFLILIKLDGSANKWIIGHMYQDHGTQNMSVGASYKAFSGTLERVRLTTVGGSDTFDNGVMNVLSI